MKQAKRFSILFVFGLATTIASGCGHGDPHDPAAKAIAAPIDALADAAERPKQFQKLFVAGAAPTEAQRQRFAKLMFQVSKVKPISESEAAVHVLLADGKGKSVGEADWTVVREGSQWKLKTAALP